MIAIIVWNASNRKIQNKKIQEFASLFIKHDINFKILIFGSGEGKYFNFGNGITLNFYDAGRISFEYDEDCKEDIE